MGELLRVASVMRTIRTLRDWRSHCEGVSTSLDGLFMTLATNNRLEEKIVTSIDSPDEMNDRASAELYDIRRKIRSTATVWSSFLKSSARWRRKVRTSLTMIP